MENPKLFMILLGCTPPGRNTEQHDVFFGIGKGLKELIPAIINFWPEAKGKVHIDAWRIVSQVGDHSIEVVEKPTNPETSNAPETPETSEISQKLFFINLGGYREKQFEEFHHKILVTAAGTEEAKQQAKKAVFYKETSLEESATHHSATAHIDDKYGIDIDDVYNIHDILPSAMKEKYEVRVFAGKKDAGTPDDYNLGYLKLDEI